MTYSALGDDRLEARAATLTSKSKDISFI